MLYIHFLNQLNSKSAELESIYLIREIKQKSKYPLSEEEIRDHFSPLFVSGTDLTDIESAVQLIEPTLRSIKAIAFKGDPLHEPVNFQRTIQILNEMPLPLENNLKYAREISSFQEYFPRDTVLLLNKIPKLKTCEEKNSCNQQLNNLFQIFLRNEKFLFNSGDLINEAHLNHITGLSESLEKGFLFNTTLEEEIKKQGISLIKNRLPPGKIEEVELISKNVNLIRKGVEKAYSHNLRMVNWSVILYSYIKWLLSLSP